MRKLQLFPHTDVRLLLQYSIGLLLISLSGTSLWAQNWPQFRGPDSRGVAEGESLPSEWSAEKNIAWKWDDPGRGWSSPIVWDDFVFLTTVTRDGEPETAKKGLYYGGERRETPEVSHQWHIICLKLSTGNELWRKSAHKGLPPTSRHIKNSYASATPVTDGEHVYAYFGDIGLFCYTIEGELVWSLPMEPQKTKMDWGPAASPALNEDRIFLVNDNEESSYLAAYDKRTGEEVWKVARDEDSNWATPFIWKNNLRTEIITPGTDMNRAYDLDGNLLYEFSGSSSITIATPYAVDGLLYVSSGYVLDPRKPIYALAPGAEGDVSVGYGKKGNDVIQWVQWQAAPYNPSTLVYEGVLYVLYDRGTFGAFDAKTGERVYHKRRLPGGKHYTASPWAYNGLIFCANEDGETAVIRAGKEFELLHVNKLQEDDMIMASPAIAHNALLLRTAKRLYCIRR